MVVSVLVESMLLALAGGLIGGSGAYLAFNGYRAATLNWASFSQVTFAFAVTPEILVSGLAWAMLMGLLGGLLPAWRRHACPLFRAARAVIPARMNAAPPV